MFGVCGGSTILVLPGMITLPLLRRTSSVLPSLVDTMLRFGSRLRFGGRLRFKGEGECLLRGAAVRSLYSWPSSVRPSRVASAGNETGRVILISSSPLLLLLPVLSLGKHGNKWSKMWSKMWRGNKGGVSNSEMNNFITCSNCSKCFPLLIRLNTYTMETMFEERTLNACWFPRSIDPEDNKIRVEGGSWGITWTTEGTMVRNNNSANSMETDYCDALDRAANEDYPGHPMPTYYRQRIMDQLISQPRIAFHDILSALETLPRYPTRQRRVALAFDSTEVVGGLLGEFDGWFRGIDVNTAANRFDLAAAAAAAGGGAGDDEDDEEDDDDYPVVSL